MPLNNSSQIADDVFVDEEGTNFLAPLIEDSTNLKKQGRTRKRIYDEKSVHPADVLDEEAKGWSVQRAGIRSTRLKRQKKHHKWLEDRIWSLFFAMGYLRCP